MTSTTTTRRRRPGAFTLAEVMIGATIGSFALVGVLSAFLMLGRSGTNIVAYTSMDTQTRRALEEFAQDIRMASDLTWNSPGSITLTVPDNYPATSHRVTYAWDNVAGSATYHCFYRKPGTAVENDPGSTRKPRSSPTSPASLFAATIVTTSQPRRPPIPKPNESGSR